MPFLALACAMFLCRQFHRNTLGSRTRSHTYIYAPYTAYRYKFVLMKLRKYVRTSTYLLMNKIVAFITFVPPTSNVAREKAEPLDMATLICKCTVRVAIHTYTYTPIHKCLHNYVVSRTHHDSRLWWFGLGVYAQVYDGYSKLFVYYLYIIMYVYIYINKRMCT